jgi:hypothetical protein
MICRKIIALCLLLCWQLSGCTLWRYELGVPLNESDTPKPGADTSLSEVLETLGPPVHMSATGTGYVMAWEYWRIREDSVGIRLGFLGADIMSFDSGKMQVKGDYLLVVFNLQHRVDSASFSHWDNYAGGGVGVQPMFSFVDVVDSGDLLSPMTQHRWGSAFLQPISRSQNRASSPHTGQNGIEQRGTTRAIGQQSLE